MAETLDLQFNTSYLDLVVKKSATASFVVTVIGNYGFNIQGGLVFAEVRRSSPGFLEASKITGSTTASQNVIQIKSYPPGQDSNRILTQLPIQVGDLITVEGSGIVASRANSVTSSQIVVANNATTSLADTRVKYRSLAIASFRVEPVFNIFTITTTSASNVGATTIPISGVTRVIPAGTKLVFVNNNTTPLPTTYYAETTAIANPLQSALTVKSLADEIPGSSTCTIGGQMITTATTPGDTTPNSGIINSNSTSFTASSLSYHIPQGTKLQFATKTTDGWSYVGSVNVSAKTSAVSGGAISNTVSINNVDLFDKETPTPIPVGSIALYSTLPSNQFRLILDSTESQYTPSGDYGYDVIAQTANGEVIRIIEGKITFLDNWSAL